MCAQLFGQTPVMRGIFLSATSNQPFQQISRIQGNHLEKGLRLPTSIIAYPAGFA
jgi:hypothetical protein